MSFWDENPKLKPAECKSCGKKILWALSHEGKRIPLDPTPPVYQVQVIEGQETMCIRRTSVLVSHFATCPDATEHSKQNANKNLNVEVRAPSGKQARVVVEGNTYDSREALKAGGWAWDPELRVWFQDVDDGDIDAACENLKDAGFSGKVVV